MRPVYFIYNPETDEIDLSGFRSVESAHSYKKALGLSGWIVLEVSDEGEDAEDLPVD